MGMARSGLAAAKLIKNRGGIPFVSDNAPRDRLTPAITELSALNIDFETDHHSTNLLSKQDLVVLSPGIAIHDPIVKELLGCGIEVISELELASRLLPCPMVAITGTNGKTTTVALIGHILTHAGISNAIAGNIGNPLSAVVDKLRQNAWAVVEVSSFQLEAAPTFRPKVAAILNVTPDHLDRHGTFESYVELKRNVFLHQEKDDTLIYNSGDPVVAKAVTGARSKLLDFATDSNACITVKHGKVLLGEGDEYEAVLDTKDIRIPGSHNIENVLAAVACTYSIGVTLDVIREGITSFQGVEHRLETVGTFQGITWINDSKATNVQAGVIALKAISPPIILLAGGRAKSENYYRVIPYFTDRVRLAIVFGEAGPMLEAAWQSNIDIKRADGLHEAVELASGAAHEGDTVLLSPMGSSFDQFRDFEERGRCYKQWVRELTPH